MQWTKKLDKLQGIVCGVRLEGAPIGFQVWSIARDMHGAVHMFRMCEREPGTYSYAWRLHAIDESEGGASVLGFANPMHQPPEASEVPKWACEHLAAWRSAPIHQYRSDIFGDWSRPPVVVVYGDMEQRG